MGNNFVSSEELTKAIVEAMQEKKANDIVVLDLRELNGAVCEFFVVCHGDSDTQVQAIADGIERDIKTNLQERPWHSEGKESAQWMLLDYVNVVAHVFYHEAREFYDIEGLWGDAKVEKIEYQV
jgi:ribosome-associated protein